jgi:S-adenosylmethionine hydrolase
MCKLVFFLKLKKMRTFFFWLITILSCSFLACGQSGALVFQSDFGLKDGAVSAMKGVAYGVSDKLHMFDNTHEIPAYNIWEAAYRLNQAAPYWPSGTVFISVVDPGVGSERKSVVLKTKSGHFFVTPDNGTLTLIAESMGIDELRQIDETKNRLKNSGDSYTFHGRDVYAYTAARLAAGVISFEQVGPVLSLDIVRLPYQKAEMKDGLIYGTIDVLDVQYGNIWTNIPQKLFHKLNIKVGDRLQVTILNDQNKIYENEVVFGNTFSDVPVGQAIGYLNSLLNFSLGINQGSFADKFKIGSGARWTIVLSNKKL